MSGGLVTANPAVLHRNIARTVERLLQLHQIFLQCNRGRHNLKNRARLIGITDAPVAPHPVLHLPFQFGARIFPVLLCQRKRVIQMKFRIIDHRIDFAILRIHDDNLHPVCLLLDIRLLRRLLTVHLNIVIERGHQIAAVDRLHPKLRCVLHLHSTRIRIG